MIVAIWGGYCHSFRAFSNVIPTPTCYPNANHCFFLSTFLGILVMRFCGFWCCCCCCSQRVLTIGPIFENEILVDLNSIFPLQIQLHNVLALFFFSATICDFTMEGIPHIILRSSQLGDSPVWHVCLPSISTPASLRFIGFPYFCSCCNSFPWVGGKKDLKSSEFSCSSWNQHLHNVQAALGKHEANRKYLCSLFHCLL